MKIRTSKFPLIFWSFNKANECELNFKENIATFIKFSDENEKIYTKYSFKKLNKFAFLTLKYLPIFLILLFAFNRYDFSFSKVNLVAYAVALILASAVNLLENLTRQITIIVIILATIFLGFHLENFFLVAYALKYFLLFSICVMIFVDSRLSAFSIINENGKILSNFLISSEFLKDKTDEKN
jgi:hypothetical protein